MSTRVLVVGAGRIGVLIGTLLAESGDYRVTLADRDPEATADTADPALPGLDGIRLDATDTASVGAWLRGNNADAVISCLPWFANPPVAAAARDAGTHYFDLTEDLASLRAVRACAADTTSAFVPMCGLAPGVVSIIAAGLARGFDTLDTVHLRVGALPAHPDNALNYALTWSTDGLINEYGNPCPAVVEGRAVTLHPLEGLETLDIAGTRYEAFNTSGGLGTLQESLAGRANEVNYKTLRYPGHCTLMKFLMQDLRLEADRDTLKRILERALPVTDDDIVVLYACVTGKRDGVAHEAVFVRHIHPRPVAGRHWTAIQVATAAGACAVLDLVMAAPGDHPGFVRQEDIGLDALLGNRFGNCFTDD